MLASSRTVKRHLQETLRIMETAGTRLGHFALTMVPGEEQLLRLLQEGHRGGGGGARPAQAPQGPSWQGHPSCAGGAVGTSPRSGRRRGDTRQDLCHRRAVRHRGGRRGCTGVPLVHPRGTTLTASQRRKDLARDCGSSRWCAPAPPRGQPWAASRAEPWSARCWAPGAPVVLRQRPVLDRGGAAGQPQHRLGQLGHRELARIAQVDRAGDRVLGVHQPHQAPSTRSST